MSKYSPPQPDLEDASLAETAPVGVHTGFERVKTVLL